jgi:hypothetical protein
VNSKTPTKVNDRIGQIAKKPLSLRYAEVVKLRQAIRRALAESKYRGSERRASK